MGEGSPDGEGGSEKKKLSCRPSSAKLPRLSDPGTTPPPSTFREKKNVWGVDTVLGKRTSNVNFHLVLGLAHSLLIEREDN